MKILLLFLLPHIEDGKARNPARVIEHSKHQILMQTGAVMGSGYYWEGAGKPVGWSKVQESVTFPTSKCCSCLNAELTYTNWVKAAGKEQGIGLRWTQGGDWSSTEGFICHWVGSFTSRPFKNKTKPRKPKYHVKLKEQ